MVALIGGALLGSFSLRAESALIDPGLDEADHRFFGARGAESDPVPGAEAKTEKLPDPAAVGSAPGQTGLTGCPLRPCHRRDRSWRRHMRWCWRSW